MAELSEESDVDETMLETALRRANSTTQAENRDVYESSARDYEIWYERELAG